VCIVLVPHVPRLARTIGHGGWAVERVPAGAPYAALQSADGAYVRPVGAAVRAACGMRHPRELDAAEVTALLSDLATRRRVSASTQNQALAALLFCTGKHSSAGCRGWTGSSSRCLSGSASERSGSEDHTSSSGIRTVV